MEEAAAEEEAVEEAVERLEVVVEAEEVVGPVDRLEVDPEGALEIPAPPAEAGPDGAGPEAEAELDAEVEEAGAAGRRGGGVVGLVRVMSASLTGKLLLPTGRSWPRDGPTRR